MGPPTTADEAARSRRPYRGRTPAERIEERRRRLLDTALELFATRGYRATSIDQICQSAGVGLKAFYEEFATKEALLLALFDVLTDQISQDYLRRSVDIQPDALALPAIVRAFVDAVTCDRRVARVMFLESTGISPEVEQHRQRTHRLIAQSITELYDVGKLGPPADEVLPPRVALALTGGMLEILRDWLIDPGDDDLDTVIESIARMHAIFLAGLRAVDRAGF